MTEFYYVIVSIFINWFLWTSLVVYGEFYPNGWIDGVEGHGFEEVNKKSRYISNRKKWNAWLNENK